MAYETGLPSSTLVQTELPIHAATPPEGGNAGGALARDGEHTVLSGNTGALDRVSFEIPGPPQGKGRPRVGKVGNHARLFTPAKTAAYEGLIAHAAHVAMAGSPPIDGPVSAAVIIDCVVPESWSRRKRAAALAGSLMPTSKPDADNVVKAVFDGCNGVAFRDDVQVVDLRVRKRYGPTPGVRVVLSRVEPEGALL